MKKNFKPLEWYQTQVKKDEDDIAKAKNDFINEIKKFKKEDILPEPPKKQNLWTRLKKVLMG